MISFRRISQFLTFRVLLPAELLVARVGLLCFSPPGFPGISSPPGPSAPAGPAGEFSPPRLPPAVPSGPLTPPGAHTAAAYHTSRV